MKNIFHIPLLLGIAFLITSCGKSPEQQADALIAELAAKQKPILEKLLSDEIERSIDNERISNDKKQSKKERARKLLFGSFDEVLQLLKVDVTQNNKKFKELQDDGDILLLLMNPAITNFAYRDPIAFFRKIASEVSKAIAEMITEEATGKNQNNPQLAGDKLLVQYMQLQAEYYEKINKVMNKK